jgi:periplasmic protein TonB
VGSCDPNGTGKGEEMFNNLIESSSHAREFKRRGSFVLFTTATYVLLFIIAGVISIYAYDARLEDQNTDIVTMLSPVELEAPKPVATTPKTTPPKGNTSKQNYVERATAMVSVNRPDIVPNKASAQPNTHLPLPDTGLYRVTGRDFDPGVPGGSSASNNGGGNEVRGPVAAAIEVGAPPPAMAPIHMSPPRVVSKGAITGLALLLPKPPYPPIAKQAGAHGPVNVQVLIDETGKVISAKAVKGHPLLMAAAQQAAYGARFSPTKLGDQAVKVSGVITYNFLLQ